MRYVTTAGLSARDSVTRGPPEKRSVTYRPYQFAGGKSKRETTPVTPDCDIALTCNDRKTYQLL